VRDLPPNATQCTELLTAQDLPYSVSAAGAKCSLAIPPFEVRVLRWSG
jgi:hypothetical protein